MKILNLNILLLDGFELIQFIFRLDCARTRRPMELFGPTIQFWGLTSISEILTLAGHHLGRNHR